MLLDLQFVDPNDKSYAVGKTTLRVFPGAIISVLAAYPLLSRFVFGGPGSLARYAASWAVLLLLGEGCLAIVVAGILTGPQAFVLFLLLVAVAGFFVLRDWVFAPRSGVKVG